MRALRIAARLRAWLQTAAETRPGFWTLSVITLAAAVAVVAALLIVYRLVDPLPPRGFEFAAGFAGSGYDNVARRYAQILARDGVELKIRHSAGAVENLELLRSPDSGVQAALSTLGFAQASDAATLDSLGGVFDAVLFIFYKSAEPITEIAQFRGKRLSIGTPGTSLRPLVLSVLEAGDALDPSTRLVDLDFGAGVDALIAGDIDVAVFPGQLNVDIVQRALAAPGIRLMNVTQAGAIAKTIPGFKRVVLARGLLSLSRDVPDIDVNLLATGNSVLVRKELHPALQYLLLQAMREVHWAPGPFNRLGEFPSEQPNDLPLSPTAERFYRSGPTFWQQYTSFWLTSLLDRFVFFVIPIAAALIPVIGFAPRLYHWLGTRRINRLHRELGKLERELARGGSGATPADHRKVAAEIEAAVHSLKVARPFEIDLHRLRVHLRMVQDQLGR
jgi:TRAP-type uncharacterized transport system substrate-binding protein